jgi:hypothetical protein
MLAKPVLSIANSDDDFPIGIPLFLKDKQAWQVLLRKHEAEKTNESIREELQKQEDVHLRSNYFVHANGTVELADVLIKTSVPEEMAFVENHIIIIGECTSSYRRKSDIVADVEYV